MFLRGLQLKPFGTNDGKHLNNPFGEQFTKLEGCFMLIAILLACMDTRVSILFSLVG